MGPLEPTSVARSSPFISPVVHPIAQLEGDQLLEGHRVLALNQSPDGTTPVDVSLYEVIEPLGGIAPNGQQLFAVKDNLSVDPSVPGHQPIILRYAPDGAPILIDPKP